MVLLEPYLYPGSVTRAILISGGSVVGGGGGHPLLGGRGTRGVTGEKGTMSKTSVDRGFMEPLPACGAEQGKRVRR